VQIVIDGKSCNAAPGQSLLEVARHNGIDIPSLCHHEGLPGRGCCRLCIVETEDANAKDANGTANAEDANGTANAKDANGTADAEDANGTADAEDTNGVADASPKRSLVISCVYPVHDSMTVYTKSEKVIRLRRTLLALLIEHAPDAEGALPAYCLEYGVTGYHGLLNIRKDEKCILCGLCVRACEELGNSAIQITRRGVDKIVAPPFDEPPQDCIGCAACARVCPTHAIDCLNDDERRTIWDKTFPLVKCAACGKPYATADELEWLKEKLLDTELNLAYCPKCRGRASRF